LHTMHTCQVRLQTRSIPVHTLYSNIRCCVAPGRSFCFFFLKNFLDTTSNSTLHVIHLILDCPLEVMFLNLCIKVKMDITINILLSFVTALCNGLRSEGSDSLQSVIKDCRGGYEVCRQGGSSLA